MKITDIKVGDWISDTAGVYEVTEVLEDKVITQDVILGEDDNYTLGDTTIKTKSDLAKCKEGA